MNKKHLGDALDHWKGSILRQLQQKRLVSDLGVEPMITDSQPWHKDALVVYAKLLHVRRGQFASHHWGTRGNRDSYFAETARRCPGDIFLDPDTGVCTGKVTRRHVTPSEVSRLLEHNRGRLIVVYQHGARATLRVRVRQVIEVLEKAVPRDVKLYWCSYEAGSVAMLFLSLDPKRPQRVAKCFLSTLGVAANRRIQQERDTQRGR